MTGEKFCKFFWELNKAIIRIDRWRWWPHERIHSHFDLTECSSCVSFNNKQTNNHQLSPHAHASLRRLALASPSRGRSRLAVAGTAASASCWWSPWHWRSGLHTPREGRPAGLQARHHPAGDPSWHQGDEDCCHWRGVRCSNLTGLLRYMIGCYGV